MCVCGGGGLRGGDAVFKLLPEAPAMRSSFVPRAITVTECLQSPTDYVYLGIYVIPLASKTYKHTADALLRPAAAQKINAAASWLRKMAGLRLG